MRSPHDGGFMPPSNLARTSLTAQTSQHNPHLAIVRSLSIPPNEAKGNEGYFNYLSRRDTGKAFWSQTTREGRLLFIATDIIEKQGGIKKFLEENNNCIHDLIFNKFLPLRTANLQTHRNAEILYKQYIKPLLMESNDNALGAALLLGLLRAQYDGNNPELHNEFDAIKFGHRLCSFLIEIGATKLAQKMDSFYKTPEDWKQGLSNSKDSAETMLEIEFEALAKNTLPSNTPFVIGKHVGTGTYLDTREITLNSEYIKKNSIYKDMPKGAELVLQLVKPDIVNRTKKLIEFALKLVDKAKQQNDNEETTEFIKGLGPILEFTAKNIDEETDLTKSPDKVEGFKKAYQGVEINMPNIKAEFVPAMMFDHGKDHRISLNLKGKHFADLKVGEDLTFEEKREMAMAIVTMELYLILSGKVFDHDRHDKNQHIQIIRDGKGKPKVIIGNFDEQGLMPAPNKKQKQLLANILMDAVSNSIRNGDNILEALVNSFNAIHENPAQVNASTTDTDYIKAVADAMLTLTKYTDYFGKGKNGFAQFKDMLKVIKAIITADGINPAIRKTIERRWRKPKSTINDGKISKKNIIRKLFDARMNQAIMNLYVLPKLLSKKPNELRLELPRNYNERWSKA